MSRAEERALKAYPISPSCLSEKDGDGDRNYPRRLAYVEGYNQAEKDIRSERTEEALLMETGIAARLSVLRELAIKKGNDELAEKIGVEIDYIYGLYPSADGHEGEDNNRKRQ